MNVLERAHYLPLFARLGLYERTQLDRLAYGERELFEFPGHALALMTIDHHPLMRWRMDAHREKSWARVSSTYERIKPGYVQAVLDEIRDRGPLAWSDLEDPGRTEKKPTKYAESSMLWWRSADGKEVLAHLFQVGDVAVAGRRNFEALYDLPERVIPHAILETPTPPVEEAHRELVRRAVNALGVGAPKEIADYYRLPVALTKARLKELVEGGDVVACRVEGWKDAAFMVAAAKAPRRCEAQALIGPFDSLIWERKRAERVFRFKVSFEIYVPPPKRVYGYYVLGFLQGEEFTARVDLKADRARRLLQVQAAFLEAGADGQAVVGPLLNQLSEMAAWLNLDGVEVADRGDLARALRRSAAPRNRG